MIKEQLKKEIEELIEALLEELGEGSEREEVTDCAMGNIVFGYYENKYTIEDVYETSKYLEIPVDIEAVVLTKVKRQKRKEQRAKARKNKRKGGKIVI